nr:MAG TPA: Primase-pol, Primase, REPLICATION [Caudoviricetes sp.]
MRLYPFKIFSLSKNKRLFNKHEPHRTIGLYDVEKMNYSEAVRQSKFVKDCKVSILLGSIIPKVNLIVLDLDDCFDSEGFLESDTEKFLKEFNADEWEVSSSGTGIHIYILTKLDLETFIVKDLEGCKSFECYTNKRHIVTTTFDFKNTNLIIGAHDEFISNLYNKVKELRKNNNKYKQETMVKTIFEGVKIENEESAFIAGLKKQSPVTDMWTLRKCGYKDSNLIEIIDTEPTSVDQSAHDAKLIRKLMYYTYDFDLAWELAKKTNYYKHKDKKHQDKFNSERYKERTRMFIRG